MDVKDIGDLCYRVIGAAMRVQTVLGPGYLEEVYKNSMLVELRSEGLKAEAEVNIPVDYRGVRVGNYKADIIVENQVILELKAVSCLVAQHEAQLVNYLTATRIDDGLLFNFGATSLQYKHKYRLYKSPKPSNPVNPVNPVQNPQHQELRNEA